MIEFFLTTLRLARGTASAWRRDPQFRSLVFLVVMTLLGGTIFYSLEEGWSVVDAFYFSVTTFGKLFTVVYFFAGLSIILGFIGTVAKETLRRQAGTGGGSEESQDDAPAS
jgi:hypothetical protein